MAKKEYNYKPTLHSIQTRSIRKTLARNIRDKYDDRMEQFKIKREIFKMSLDSPFKQINQELQVVSFQKIKAEIMKELFNLKNILIKKAEVEFGKQIFTTVLTGGLNLAAQATTKSIGVVSKSFTSSQIAKTLKEINDTLDKIKMVKNPLEFIELENKKELEKWDKENKPQSPFVKLKSSWMDTGMYDETSLTMFVQTKPEKGKVYSFSVNGITQRMWELIANADGAGKMLWDTAWASKRTKSVGFSAGTGIVRGTAQWLAS